MPGHSRPKDGVLSHAYVPGIHVFTACNSKDVDGRDKPGHDELGGNAFDSHPLVPAEAGTQGTKTGSLRP